MGESSHCNCTTQEGLCQGGVGEAPFDSGHSPSLVRRACWLSRTSLHSCSLAAACGRELGLCWVHQECQQLSTCVSSVSAGQAVLLCGSCNRPGLLCLLKPRECADHLSRWRSRCPMGFFSPDYQGRMFFL